MAKVEIHITDGPKNAVDVRVFLDPPVDPEKRESTPAQSLAAELLHFVASLGGEFVDVDAEVAVESRETSKD